LASKSDSSSKFIFPPRRQQPQETNTNVGTVLDEKQSWENRGWCLEENGVPFEDLKASVREDEGYDSALHAMIARTKKMESGKT
jgi:hypothetical protein